MVLVIEAERSGPLPWAKPSSRPLAKALLGVPLGADVPDDLSQVFRSRLGKGDEPVVHDAQQRQVSRGGRQGVDVLGASRSG